MTSSLEESRMFSSKRITSLIAINVHGANMGLIWGQQDPGGPHVGPMNIAIWDTVIMN